jgi:hypothetical protein
MFSKQAVQDFAAAQVHQPKVPYVGQWPDGTHVLAANHQRLLVREVRGQLLLERLKFVPVGKR